MTTTELCPCGTERSYAQCCEPLIAGKSAAQTAEALMRSRYSAYVKGAIPYIQETLDPSQQQEFDEASVRKWSSESEWHGLKVLKTEGGLKGDDAGTVEFVASYAMEGKPVSHHEIAEFRRREGRWYFFDSKFPKAETIRREEPKVGRNDPCSCGSGKKYKKCCG